MTNALLQTIKAALIAELEAQPQGRLYFVHEEGKFTTVEGDLDLDELAAAVAKAIGPIERAHKDDHQIAPLLVMIDRLIDHGDYEDTFDINGIPTQSEEAKSLLAEARELLKTPN